MDQVSLKPQDLLVAVKIALTPQDAFTYGRLAAAVGLVPSRVHASVKFLTLARLVTGSSRDGLFANNARLVELIVHGVPFIFPALIGGASRGMATGISQLDAGSNLSISAESDYVWPDAAGVDRGNAISPIHSSVVTASRNDPAVHKMFSAIDALRIGAAREREMAVHFIRSKLE